MKVQKPSEQIENVHSVASQKNSVPRRFGSARVSRGSAAAPSPADLPVASDNYSDSGPSDAPTHTSGHSAIRRGRGSIHATPEVSHQDGRKSDLLDESRQAPSKKDQFVSAAKSQSEIEAKKNPAKAKPPKEILAWQVIRFWNKQENVHSHTLRPISKTLKKAVKLIGNAFDGKLVVDHPLCPNERHFTFTDFQKAIEKFNAAIVDYSLTSSTRDWFRKIPITTFFINNPKFEIKDKNSKSALRTLSPFLYFVQFDVAEESSEANKEDDSIVNEIFRIVADHCDGPFQHSNYNLNEIRKFISWLRDFITENSHGLGDDICNPASMAEEYCKFAVDGKGYFDTGLLQYHSLHSDFLDHCIETGIIYDAKMGKLYYGSTKYWFQLTDKQRAYETSKEDALKDAFMKKKEQVRIATEIAEADGTVSPNEPFDKDKEREKIVKFNDKLAFKAKHYALLRKVKELNSDPDCAKEFDALWIKWIKETKPDSSNLDEFEQIIAHLLRKSK